MELDIPFIGTAIKQMLKTVPLTLAMTIIPIIAGFFIALGNITVRIFRIKWLLACSAFYVSFFRSTPAILHIMLIYLGVPLINGIVIWPYLTAPVALGRLILIKLL